MARVLEVDGPSLVLGSSQSPDLVDSQRTTAAGVAVARRRSGGGAVYLDAGCQVWVDLFIPRGDRLWDDDVVRAADWAGEMWGAAAASLTDQPAAVHRGGSVGGRWGRLICFAGLGPAEVTVGGRKIVGISQRRSRGWIRIQTMARVAPGEGAAADRASTPLDGIQTVARVAPGEGVVADRASGALDRVQTVARVVPGADEAAASDTVLDEAALLALTEDERSRGRAVMTARSGALTVGPGPLVDTLLRLLPD